VFLAAENRLDYYQLEASKLQEKYVHLFIQNSEVSPANKSTDTSNHAACAVMNEFQKCMPAKYASDFIMEQWAFRSCHNFLTVVHYAFPENFSAGLLKIAAAAGFRIIDDKVRLWQPAPDTCSRNILVELASSDKIVVLQPEKAEKKSLDDEKKC
jgi:hypothetical protein